VNFGSVTPKFKRGKGLHPLVDQQVDYIHSIGGSTARSCGDQYWVFWGDLYSVLFQLYARGCHCYDAQATR